jgi:5-methylthioadenosine/S-adenosylhomocysteine deaminase
MIRFYNALILKRNPDGRYYTESGELVTDGGKIVRVGGLADGDSGASVAGSRFARQIDCRGGLLIPGLKNCHTHSAMTLLRGAGEGLPLKRWLFERVFPYEARMSPEDVYWAAHTAVAEYLAGGVTAVQDMYFFADETARAVREAGFQCVGVGASSDLDGKTEETLVKQETLLKKYPPGGAFSFRAGFHAEYTASDALLKGVKLLSDKFNSPAHFHLSETEEEVWACFERTGKTPPERIASFGLFERGGAAYHCVHLKDGDLKYFAPVPEPSPVSAPAPAPESGGRRPPRADFAIVANPRSNLKLGSGIAPLAKYLSRGIKTALGTDGSASNNRLSVFDELNTAALLSHLAPTAAGDVQPDRLGIGTDAALDTVFYNGAEVLELDARTLDAGRRADVVLLDIDRPNMRPRENLINHLVYSASDANVLLTMVGGKILYENGEYKTGVDYERVRREFDKAVKRLYETN